MGKNIQKVIWQWLIFSCFILIILGCNGCDNEGPWKPGMPLPKEKIKIAVIHLNEFDKNSFYDNSHNEGILEMQRNLGILDTQIINKVNVFDGDLGIVEGVMRDCIFEGVNIIIATSWGYMDVCEKLAAEFPSVIFIQAMGSKSNNRNFTFYTTRLYQARYLSGIAAGMKTRTGKIGYVAALGKSNSEVTAGINAFALGVEEVNPTARVFVKTTYSWYDPMGETDAANNLIDFGCDVIAAHCDTSMVQIAAQKAGVLSIGFNSDMNAVAPNAVITSVVPRWGVIYTRFLESVIDGTFIPMPYFYGLSEGAVGITPINEKLAAPGTKTAVETAMQSIVQGGFNIFDGVLETNTGAFIGEQGKTLKDEVILGGINWYYRNIVEQ